MLSLIHFVSAFLLNQISLFLQASANMIKVTPLKKFKLLLALVFFSLFFLGSCKFNEAQQSTGELFLQGSWEDDSLQNQSQLVSYQQYNFRFKCDSFYVQIRNFSKVNLQGGDCYNSNTWLEYAKGYYTVVNDTLKFDGNFVDFEYKYKTQGSCYRNGKFTDTFLIESKTDSLLQLKSLQSGMLHKFLLIDTLSCNK